MSFHNSVRGVALAAGLLSVVCGGQSAWAHKVLMDVYPNGSNVEGELGFSDGSSAHGATVEILDDKDNKIAEVKTDDKGIFHYTPAKRQVLKFRANLGAGHVGFATMGLDDLPEAVGTGAAPAAAVSAASAAAMDRQPSASEARPADTDQLTKIIGEEVRRNVKPLREMVYQLKEKNSLQTVLGGIGYILGLFGIGFYVAARYKFRKDA